MMMMMKVKIRILSVFVIFLAMQSTAVYSQDAIIDKVVAVVGKNIILHSDIEKQYINVKQHGYTVDTDARCQILQDLLIHKLMLHQAQLDSVVVSNKQVEARLDHKIRYYIAQFGSKEKLEEFYDKSVEEIKAEFIDITREQMLVEEIQRKITKDIKVTPAEVVKFFNEIPKDSIPLINSEVEVAHIVKKPPVSIEAIDDVKKKLKEYSDRVKNGDDFAVLAGLYSEDPGTRNKGGETGFFGRGEMAPEFEAAAFSLIENNVSPIIKTEYGFHILQLIERRGQNINVRHILKMPTVSFQALKKAKETLTNVVALIKMDSISFDAAALKFSDDPSKKNKGLIINTVDGTSRFQADELDPSLSFAINKLEVGEVSDPVLKKDDDGSKSYRIVYLKSRTKPHTANLSDDWGKLQNAALVQKQNKAINDWIMTRAKETFIKIHDEKFKKCKFIEDWQKK